MGVKTSGGYCRHCNKNVMTQKNTPNHLLHLILSVFTLGLWVIVWLLLILGHIGGSRCTECGHKV